MKRLILSAILLLGFAQSSGGSPADLPIVKNDLPRTLSYDPMPGDHELEELISESETQLATAY